MSDRTSPSALQARELLVAQLRRAGIDLVGPMQVRVVLAWRWSRLAGHLSTPPTWCWLPSTCTPAPAAPGHELVLTPNVRVTSGDRAALRLRCRPGAGRPVAARRRRPGAGPRAGADAERARHRRRRAAPAASTWCWPTSCCASAPAGTGLRAGADAEGARHRRRSRSAPQRRPAAARRRRPGARPRTGAYAERAPHQRSRAAPAVPSC